MSAVGQAAAADPLVAAVDRLADRIVQSLPKHVSPKRSVVAGLATFGVLMGIAWIPIRLDRKEHASSADVLLRSRWMAMLLVAIGVAAKVADLVQDKVFFFQNFSVNGQHIVLLKWAHMYAQRLRA